MPKGRKISVLLIMLILLNFIMVLPSAAESPANNGANIPADPIRTFFKDLQIDDSNLIFINYIVACRIMSGFPDGTFRPAQGISRAQMAAIIARIKKLPVVAGANAGFKDVPEGYWAGACIAAVNQGSYMEGFADGSFHPDEELSRAQGIAAIMRLVSSDKNPAALPPLEDMGASHWAAGAVATALASGMINVSDDGRKIFPEKALTRGELACCLAIMLTRHPDLYGVNLSGRIKPAAGEVFLLRQGQETLLSAESDIQQGDQVRTGSKATAELNFPDGSSMLLVENSIINISENLGRSYLKADGSPGIAVDNLNIKLQEGMVYGALATGPESGEPPEEDRQTGALRIQQEALPLLAAINGLPLMAANNEAGTEAPWWDAPRNQKVRMKIDMPWGVTAIRGTFVSIILTLDGKSRVACLTGNAELSAKDEDGQAGQAVALPGGKASSLSADGNPPAPPENLGAEDIAGFTRVVEWIIKTAQEMDKQQEATPLAEEIEEEQEEDSVLQKITKTLEDNGIKLDESLLEKIPGISQPTADETTGGGGEPEEYKDIATDKSWTLIFNEEIDPNTILGNICVSRDSLGIFKVPIVAQVDPKYDTVISLKPQTNWGAGQTYYIIIGKGVQSVGGVSLGDTVKVMFTTVSEEPLGNLLEQAKTMLGLGKIIEAIELATAAMEQAADDYRAYLIRGQAYLSIDQEKAKADLSQAFDLNPWAPEIKALKSYLDWSPGSDSEAEAPEQEAEEDKKALQLFRAY